MINSKAEFNFLNIDFTISFWMKLSEKGNFTIMSKSTGLDLFKSKWKLEIGPNNVVDGYFFTVFNETAKRGTGNGGDFNFILGSWYHIVLARSGNTFNYYINGSGSGSGSFNITFPSTDVPLFFGSDETGITGGPKSLKGILDDIAIYNRALTADEILKIYNGTGF